MKKMGFPLKLRMKGPEVGKLQAALQMLLSQGIILKDDESRRRELFKAMHAEFVRQIYGSVTGKIVAILQEEQKLKVSGEVDDPTADILSRLIDELRVSSGKKADSAVEGRVCYSDGVSAAGFRVTAFDRDLRSEQVLGHTKTDSTGSYKIRYSPLQLFKREKGTADLVMKVFTEDDALLLTSATLFKAPPSARIDLSIPDTVLQPPSLYEKIELALDPLLNGIEVKELQENGRNQDITFLAGETGFDNTSIARYVLAHKLTECGIQPEFWFVMLGGSLYQFTDSKTLEEQLTLIIKILHSLDSTAVRKALLRGFNQNEILKTYQKQIEKWIEAFIEFIAGQSISASAEPSFIKLALDDAGITERKRQEKIARLIIQHRAMTEELINELEKDDSFKKSEIDKLTTSFRLADLTKADFSIVEAIRKEFGIHKPEQIRSLAKKDLREWVKLVEKKHAAGEIKLPIEVKDVVKKVTGKSGFSEAVAYGQILERQFREAFPTAAFTGGLERAMKARNVRCLRHADSLASFLDQHEDFEFLNTPIDDFLQSGVKPKFKKLAKDETFKQELKAVQRVFKLMPGFEATDTLLEDDLHSAQKIYRMGESKFTRRYANRPGFTKEMARLAWNRAADTLAAALTIVTDLMAHETDALCLAKDGNPSAFSEFPNWKNLFKSGDLCECEHCRSVLSPAAYFADLLLFLKDREDANPTLPVKTTLFNRRPDLGFIELNCDNALTPLPYIDVVCEVMEDVVAAGADDPELIGLNAIPADDGATRDAIVAALDAQDITLSSEFTLSQVNPSDPDRWVVHGTDVTYLLSKNGTPNFFAKILRNTKTNAQELRAYPQYVSAEAYIKLRESKYPLSLPLELFDKDNPRRADQCLRTFSLPFDLFAEEVRAAFKKCNLKRWELMGTLRGTASPNNPTDSDIAAEYFGISTSDPTIPFDEKRLILDSNSSVAHQREVWDETGTNWLTKVSKVNNFLNKTGLEYNELMALIDLSFINPTGDIHIAPQDSSCDTEQKTIQNLDEPTLDRIHRFLRLWRKLSGWKMRELDLVIHNPAIGNDTLNEHFLTKLFYFCRIKEKLGRKATVEKICALFDNLNTESHFTKLHEKREPALYHSLFLNRRLIQPIDVAFKLNDTGDEIAKEPDAVSGLPVQPKIDSHLPAILAGLGIREADLDILRNLKKPPPDGSSYVNDELKLANLSFLWRHSWLAKMLKYKIEDWRIVLKVFHVNLPFFASPQETWEFLEDIDHLKATDFKPDELNWLLAADRKSKAAVKESDAARFLTSLRAELKSIQSEHDPNQYSFLSSDPPTEVDKLSSLLLSLLQKLNRDEASAQLFLATLRDELAQELVISSLPEGFDFPSSITDDPIHIPISYSPILVFKGAMTAAQKSILLNDPSLNAVTALQAYRDTIEELSQHPGRVVVARLPSGFTFPDSITGAPANIPIQYKPVLRFTGLMTDTQKATLLTHGDLATVTGSDAYKKAVSSLFERPRLALKFFEQVFTAELEDLPAEVDFTALPDPTLIPRISYNGELRELEFLGIMSEGEKADLEELSNDLDYLGAINSLAAQPELITHLTQPERIWLQDSDLEFPLRDLANPQNGNLTANLAKAVKRALSYLSKTLSEGLVIQRCGMELDLTEGITRYLLTHYTVLPESFMAHVTGPLASTSGVVDYSTLKNTFDGWYWVIRVAIILNKWKIKLTELKKIVDLTSGAKLLDLQQSLPLDDTGTIPSIDEFLRISRLIRLQDRTPEIKTTFLEVLESLNGGLYATEAEFADDVYRLNDVWLETDVEALVRALDPTFPGEYLLVKTWERLHLAFYFLDCLNSSGASAIPFADPVMDEEHAKAIKDLLLSKFGSEAWLALSEEIQDLLRERKRDALAAYLLTHTQPSDIPTGKWENINDLYAYYLLDVEMSSCQLTSRLVQASGSVQLFVQRCLMGLELNMAITSTGAEGDGAWRWWHWMRKYRVWEANRKVFLWPENWIEPELKKDRSTFFKDLENELLQNEINHLTVEKAYINYLEKLDDVAQLEIAGFFHEDDGDNTIIHVFGRTKAAEPHIYYYRCFDYRQWTPWEKVDLDIQGDYLVPTVINKRLFLFWPFFTEVPDEVMNRTVTIPAASPEKQENEEVPKTWKKLRLQMAVSEYRQGKWTPKRVSKDYAESSPYTEEIVRNCYQFYPIDGIDIDGRIGVIFNGYSESTPRGGSARVTETMMSGYFEIYGCKGVPELLNLRSHFWHAIRPEVNAVGDHSKYLKWLELDERTDSSQDDFTLEELSPPGNFTLVDVSLLYYFSLWEYSPKEVLRRTPGIFRMTPSWHLSYFDKLLLDGALSQLNTSSFLSPPASSTTTETGTDTININLSGGGAAMAITAKLPQLGIWLPFFYNDQARTFIILPLLDGMEIGRSGAYYFPEIKQFFQEGEAEFESSVNSYIEGLDLGNLTDAQRNQLTQVLQQRYPEIPYLESAEEWKVWFKNTLKKYRMSQFHLLLGSLASQLFKNKSFHFRNFYHPFVCEFTNMVYNPLKGLPALLSRETQLKNNCFNFQQIYNPAESVVETIGDPNGKNAYPEEIVDFSPDGAYSPYNWELFFHVPLLIANALSSNQRFEEARDWYHFIFNPLGLESSAPGGSTMGKYWITKPFYESMEGGYLSQRIDKILRMLAKDSSDPGYSESAKKELEAQVLDWRINPFEPHRIANYRNVAYQKTVVMKYLDNLITWGDYLFRQDSMESINEATQMYILAAEILGPRPRRIPQHTKPAVESFHELENDLDSFANALIEVENLIPLMPGSGVNGGSIAPLPIPILYFCIPQNEKMLEYWDIIADRLYKIRHCMNIEGVERQLALFEPPIDPGALVKAVAAGIDISSALADLNAPLPLYRFNIILQKANELCNDLKALGSALLSALEKKDSEALGLLRQNLEIRVLEAVKAVREKQIEEAKENLENAKLAKELALIKKNYYEDREFMNTGETLALTLSGVSTAIDAAVAVAYIASGGLRALPQFIIGGAGFGGSPSATSETGGRTFGEIGEDTALTLSAISRALEKGASIASTVASYHRRQDEWEFQEDLAAKEIEQNEKQIASTELRLALTEKERDNHLIQIENAKTLDDYMHSKYTNEELYQWQVSQISGIYFQCYKLAYDLARQAERCFRFELGLQDSSYIKFGYWDSLKKGLLAGEKLQYDLRKLESAYLELNRREFELTKHISLALQDPLALVKFRETGRCFFQLPEEIFDLDFPGHYFRRIKSVSITLPCVVGPYTTVSATLRLLKNRIRSNTTSGDSGYPHNTDDQGYPLQDNRFIENNIPVKATAISNARDDSGVFELSFRGERYLPFEGAGVISDWSLELFTDRALNNPDRAKPDFGKPLRQFDYSTISDAIIHVKYTTREDVGTFKDNAITHLRDYFSRDETTPSMLILDLRKEFPAEWHRFLHPTTPADGNVLEVKLGSKTFQFRDQAKPLKINSIWMLARSSVDVDYDVDLQPPAPATKETFVLSPENQYGGLHFDVSVVDANDIKIDPDGPAGMWQLTMTRSGGDNLREDPVTKKMEVEDVLLVLGYELEW